MSEILPTALELRDLQRRFTDSLTGSLRVRNRGPRKAVSHDDSRQAEMDRRIMRCSIHGLQCFDGHCPMCENRVAS